MFVRWKRRALRRRRPWSPPNEQTLCAVLVENRRVDGKSRQRVVRYLGSIREGSIDKPLSADRFWGSVDSALSSLDIDDARRQAIEGVLAPVVPRPNVADVERTRKELEAFSATVAAVARGRGRRQLSTPVDGVTAP